MNKKFKKLNEDTQSIYNKWVSGIAKREAPADVITIDDIVNRFRNTTNYVAPKILPFPLSMLLDQIGNIFIKSAELRYDLVKSIDRSPIINESKEKKKAVESLNKKMKNIQEILYSCTEELNVLVEKIIK
jgi:hypothetical protein